VTLTENGAVVDKNEVVFDESCAEINEKFDNKTIRRPAANPYINLGPHKTIIRNRRDL
jgi:hypothetical protein